jgi:gliding motility-associated-like protein
VVDIVLFGVDAFAGPDTTVCQGLPVELSAAGGVQYEWAPAGSLSDAFVPDPIATPDTTTTYTVTITTTENCVILDSLTVNVFFELPEQALIDTTICAGDTVSLSTGLALTYTREDQPGVAPLDVRTPQFFPNVPTLFIVAMGNSCGTVLDSVFIDVITVVASAWPDTLICPGIPVQLGASGGTTYAWSPAEGLNDPALATPQATPSISTTYIVDVSDDLGCSDTAQVTVQLRSPPTVEAGPDVIIEYGDATILNASGSAPLTWSPTDLLNDPLSESPLVSPEESTAFMVTATDPDGCIATDILNVIVTGSLYVPNTFSPNGDGVNDSFGAMGKDIATAQLLVFNRWGELIWSTDKLSGRWDGTYKGVASPIDTYVWKLQATELSGRIRDAIGHVNLIR